MERAPDDSVTRSPVVMKKDTETDVAVETLAVEPLDWNNPWPRPRSPMSGPGP